MGLDVAYRLGEAVFTTVAAAPTEQHRPRDLPIKGACRVCGAEVRWPRRVYCGARCSDVMWGARSRQDTLSHVRRKLVVLRARVRSTFGAPAIVRSQLAYFESWERSLLARARRVGSEGAC